MFRDQQNTRYHRFAVEIELSVLFQNTQCSFAFFEVVRYADIPHPFTFSNIHDFFERSIEIFPHGLAVGFLQLSGVPRQK